ncbi:hypothetical protein B0H13DRAFT_2682109 [Mycena leptocephala]|nr:hypothetical protein B0H13DRAFT_2682109 [Mycena leptocephala]
MQSFTIWPRSCCPTLYSNIVPYAPTLMIILMDATWPAQTISRRCPSPPVFPAFLRVPSTHANCPFFRACDRQSSRPAVWRASALRLPTTLGNFESDLLVLPSLSDSPALFSVCAPKTTKMSFYVRTLEAGDSGQGCLECGALPTVSFLFLHVLVFVLHGRRILRLATGVASSGSVHSRHPCFDGTWLGPEVAQLARSLSSWTAGTVDSGLASVVPLSSFLSLLVGRRMHWSCVRDTFDAFSFRATSTISCLQGREGHVPAGQTRRPFPVS